MKSQSRQLIDRFGRKADGDDKPSYLMKSAHGFSMKFDENTGTIEGYGSKWDFVDSYGEAVKKGAFTESLAEYRKAGRPIPMLWQHSSSMPIGIWDFFEEDDTGLFLRGKVNKETARGRDALSDVKMGSVNGLSIGYYELIADTWNVAEKQGFRNLYKLDLRETSVVTFPALREATIDAVKAAKGMVARGETISAKAFAKALQGDLGFSAKDSVFIANHGYKAWADLKGDVPGDDLSDVATLMKQMADSFNH